MKSLYKLLFICFFSQIYLSSLSGQNLEIDYASIKERMSKDTVSYQRIMNRYQRNDTTLTLNDYAFLYYGYSFTPQYKGSFDPNKEKLEKLIDNQKYQEAYAFGNIILRDNPVALYVLYNMYYLAQSLERPFNEANNYISRYSQLLHTIASSGDGKSQETAFKVITVNDEYHVMYNYWGVEKVTSQLLIGNCDLIEFTNSRHFKGNEMYFDISRSLDKMKELFD